MGLPDFIKALPAIEIPFPDSAVRTSAVKSDRGLAVFFEAFEDITLPPHSHLGQWGTVIQGELILTIGGETRSYFPGDSYDIPAHVEHSGTLKAGSIVVDLFEEEDRYPLRD